MDDKCLSIYSQSQLIKACRGLVIVLLPTLLALFQFGNNGFIHFSTIINFTLRAQHTTCMQSSLVRCWNWYDAKIFYTSNQLHQQTIFNCFLASYHNTHWIMHLYISYLFIPFTEHFVFLPHLESCLYNFTRGSIIVLKKDINDQLLHEPENLFGVYYELIPLRPKGSQFEF